MRHKAAIRAGRAAERTRATALGVARNARAQFGQSVVEIALVTPVILLLLVGTIEIGRFAYYGIEVSNAARAGVQYGAQSLADSRDVPGITQAAQNDAPEVTGMNVTTTNRCACSNSPANYVGCPARGCAPGHGLVFLQVDTTANIQPLFRYPGMPASFAAKGQAIRRVTQ
jgi:Flp pilus assembly protein TadG